ncbi:MAG: hypothetical protein AB1791_22420 [Chloroflexota bacterium]
MKQLSAAALRELILEIQTQLSHLSQLEADIQQTQADLAHDPDQAWSYYSALSLHLHNFYTNCEYIFQIVVSQLEQGLVIGSGWHQQLLERMGAAWENQPAVLSLESLRLMRDFLTYRHFVRDSDGLELDLPTLNSLLESYPQIWGQVKTDVLYFVDWLRVLAETVDNSEKAVDKSAEL